VPLQRLRLGTATLRSTRRERLVFLRASSREVTFVFSVFSVRAVPAHWFADPSSTSGAHRPRERLSESVDPRRLALEVFPTRTSSACASQHRPRSAPDVTPPSELDHPQATATLPRPCGASHEVWSPSALSEHGIHEHLPALPHPATGRLQGFSPSWRVDPPRSFRPCFMPVTLLGLSPSEPFPPTQAVASLDARNPPDVHLRALCCRLAFVSMPSGSEDRSTMDSRAGGSAARVGSPPGSGSCGESVGPGLAVKPVPGSVLSWGFASSGFHAIQTWAGCFHPSSSRGLRRFGLSAAPRSCGLT
jgi:hypothetical protein